MRTYYNSIATACATRFLGAWSSLDERRSKLAAWLSDAEFIAKDLDSLYAKQRTLRGETDGIREQLSEQNEIRENASHAEQRRSELQSVQAFLAAGADTFSGALPPDILEIAYSELIRPMNDFPAVDILVNHFWTEKDFGTADDRSRYLREAVLNWRTVTALRPRLAGDLDYLSQHGGEAVMSPECSAKLAELERKRQEILDVMENDATKVVEYQSIQSEIRVLKRSSAT